MGKLPAAQPSSVQQLIAPDSVLFWPCRLELLRPLGAQPLQLRSIVQCPARGNRQLHHAPLRGTHTGPPTAPLRAASSLRAQRWQGSWAAGTHTPCLLTS